MYGSSFMFATRRPRFSMSAPIDAARSPFPREDTTPPVTNTYLVWLAMVRGRSTEPGGGWQSGGQHVAGDRGQRRFAVDPGTFRDMFDPPAALWCKACPGTSPPTSRPRTNGRVTAR